MVQDWNEKTVSFQLDTTVAERDAQVKNVDEEELFYMMSRGIPKRAAMQLMVFGFFEEIIEKVASVELAENLRQLIHKKFKAKLS